MDSDAILSGIRNRYADVAQHPDGQFPYPVGHESLTRLGYRPEWLAAIAPAVIDRFVGVGNPFSLGAPQRGWHVVDVGCGTGTDAQVAGHLVGPSGTVIGVDMSPEMLAVARTGQVETSRHVEFREGEAAALPVPDGWADLVISNGALNLAADKPAAFAEIARVLRPGGVFQAADLILVKPLPPDLRNDEFAWSN